MAAFTIAERKRMQEDALEERAADAAIAAGVKAANYGMRSGSFPCRCCGTRKPRPSAECSKCGDVEGSYNGDSHEIDRAHGYAFTESAAVVRRDRGKRGKLERPIEPAAKVSSPDKVSALLEKRAELERKLTRELRALPRGDGRREAVRRCVTAGLTQAQLTELLGVSRQRVSQLVAESTGCPF